MNDYGQGQLPKKAERVYSKPGKTDLVGHFIDVRTGEVQTIAYRAGTNGMPGFDR